MRTLALVLLLWALAPRPTASAADEATTVRLKKRVWSGPLWAPAGRSNEIRPGEATACGAWALTLEPTKTGAVVSWTGPGRGGKATLKARPGVKVLRLGQAPRMLQVLVFADPLGVWRHVNALVQQGEVAGRRLSFFDADYDGTYFEPGEDWLAAEGARHALPCSEAVVLGNHVVTFGKPEPTKGLMTIEMADASGGVGASERAAQAALNDVRLHYGLPGVLVDAERSAHCRLHAQWCAVNRRMAHSEPEGSPGYTPEGEAAAHASLIWHGHTPARAFFGLWDTPMHGYPLAAPWYTRTAIGYEGGYLVVWWHEGDDFRQSGFDERMPAVFPPDGAAGVPVEWHGELPDPRVGDTSKPWGYPLRIYLRKRFRARFLAMSEVKARLVPVGTDDAVPLQIHADPLDFVLLPRVPLAPRTTYHLSLSWTERARGTRRLESTFTTGKQSGQRREGLEK